MDIWECALGFMDSQILMTADELGVFDRLDAGPGSVPDIAEATGMPEEPAARLLVALCALGLVQKTPDGRYCNGPEAAAQLVRGKPGYIGAMFNHLRDDLYPVWRHFKHALLEGRAQWERAFPDHAQPHARVHADPRALRQFMAGMHAITYEAARELATLAPEVRRIHHIVDVGGASGAFVIALAEANPILRGTVFDLPQVQPIADEFIRAANLQDHVRFQAGDFWEEELPAGADAYSMGFILHDWDDQGQSVLLEKLAKACPAGGMLIVGEYLLNDERTGPLWVARSDLNLLVAARGKERSAPEYREWLRRFGFELKQIYQTSKGKNFLIARRVPAE